MVYIDIQEKDTANWDLNGKHAISTGIEIGLFEVKKSKTAFETTLFNKMSPAIYFSLKLRKFNILDRTVLTHV